MSKSMTGLSNLSGQNIIHNSSVHNVYSMAAHSCDIQSQHCIIMPVIA